ncbi:hypothetical protein D4764_12G0001240 [Takifugu flavidus]|uniref:Uncharacterized protein n=1 Tax=Takifugu flavidus TaxID=433684 RepID=A0A5C6PAC1_9TELE|nr:hypothetical protein D4764_12G0001240 [Takifugu flavidus]
MLRTAVLALLALGLSASRTKGKLGADENQVENNPTSSARDVQRAARLLSPLSSSHPKQHPSIPQLHATLQ